CATPKSGWLERFVRCVDVHKVFADVFARVNERTQSSSNCIRSRGDLPQRAIAWLLGKGASRRRRRNRLRGEERRTRLVSARLEAALSEKEETAAPRRCDRRVVSAGLFRRGA